MNYHQLQAHKGKDFFNYWDNVFYYFKNNSLFDPKQDIVLTGERFIDVHIKLKDDCLAILRIIEQRLKGDFELNPYEIINQIRAQLKHGDYVGPIPDTLLALLFYHLSASAFRDLVGITFKEAIEFLMQYPTTNKDEFIDTHNLNPLLKELDFESVSDECIDTPDFLNLGVLSTKQLLFKLNEMELDDFVILAINAEMMH